MEPDAAQRGVYMARHGQTASNLVARYAGRRPEPLTTEGRSQMAHLADRLRGRGIVAVWTSTVVRARESAAIVAGRLGLDVSEEPRLDELLMGSWEGLTERECAERYPEAYSVWRARPDELRLEGREPLVALAHRVGEVVERAAEQRAPILLMTHVAPIRVAVLGVLGHPMRWYPRLGVANADCFVLDPACSRVRRLERDHALARE